MGVRNLRRAFWWGLCVLVTLLIVFVIIGGWGWVERSYIYPYDYRSYIETSAAHYSADPYLVAAVVKHESKFQPRARSDGGALGLMQLMPATAAWIARQLDEPFTEDDLYDPALNIRYGVWYLAELEAEFGGNDIPRSPRTMRGAATCASGWSDTGGTDSLTRSRRFPTPRRGSMCAASSRTGSSIRGSTTNEQDLSDSAERGGYAPPPPARARPL